RPPETPWGRGLESAAPDRSPPEVDLKLGPTRRIKGCPWRAQTTRLTRYAALTPRPLLPAASPPPRPAPPFPLASRTAAAAHHDRVLLYDSDEHDDAHKGVDAQVPPEDHERQQRSEPRKRKAGQDRQRMDEALVQDAEHQIDHHDGQHQQNEQTLLRLLKRR